MDAHLEQQVRKRAFELWETGAMQGGTDLDHWVAAESEVKAELAATSIEPVVAKTKRTRSTKAASSKASAKSKK